MKLSSSDRKALVKLAKALPKGSEERRTILNGLKTASGVRIEIEVQSDTGLSWDELLGLDEGEEEALKDTILKYLGGSRVEALRMIGGEAYPFLDEAFKKSKKLVPGDNILGRETLVNAGSFGSVKAIQVEGYISVYLLK